MTQSPLNKLGFTPAPPVREHGNIRIIILVLVFCLIGVVVGGFWFYGTTKRGMTHARGKADGQQHIENVARARGPAPRLANTSPANFAAAEEVKRTIPNLASVSMEEGTRILRRAALEDFKATVAAMEIQIAKARQSLSQAQSGGSEAEQQAAVKQLQQVQSEQTEKLKQIAARSAAQIEALRQLKETAH